MCFEKKENGQFIIRIHVTPGSSVNEILGTIKDEQGKEYLKVKIRDIPEKGKANESILKFLAKQFKIPSYALTLQSGHKSRYKIILSDVELNIQSYTNRQIKSDKWI